MVHPRHHLNGRSLARVQRLIGSRACRCSSRSCYSQFREAELMKFLVEFWGLRKTLQDAYVSRQTLLPTPSQRLILPFKNQHLTQYLAQVSRFTVLQLLQLELTGVGICWADVLALDAWQCCWELATTGYMQYTTVALISATVALVLYPGSCVKEMLKVCLFDMEILG